VEQARGQTARAQERLRSLAARTRRPSSLREIQARQAWLALAADDLPAAERWYTVVAAQSDGVTLVQQEREALIIARLRLAQGHAQAALDLGDWRADAHAQGRTRSEIEILCLQALAHAAQSDLAQAGRTLTRALAIAQPRGFRRVFLDEGASMAALLQATIPQFVKRPLAAYATTLLRAFAPTQMASLPHATSPWLEPLSPQEQRVLRLLAAGLSNPEIARELIVSTNTVKTQVKSIFRKLDVSNRQEAAEAARELNLL
jgi:LuxR family maltose regulon positive regulatory protein